MHSYVVRRILSSACAGWLLVSVCAADTLRGGFAGQEGIDAQLAELGEAAEAADAVEDALVRQFAEIRHEHHASIIKLRQAAEELRRAKRTDVEQLDQAFRQHAETRHNEYNQRRQSIEETFEQAHRKLLLERAQAYQRMLEARERFQADADGRTAAALHRVAMARQAMAHRREGGRPPTPEEPERAEAAGKPGDGAQRSIPAHAVVAQHALQDVLGFYSDTAGGNFWVDWQGLNAAGVKRDTAIALRLGRMFTAREALLQALKTAAGDQLAIGRHGSILVLSTPKRLKGVLGILADAEKRACDSGARVDLMTTLPDVGFIEVHLVYVLEYFSDIFDVTINTDWKALQKLGITAETPVTLRLRNCTLTEVVALIFLSHPGGEAVTLTGGDDGLRIGVAEKP